MALFVKQMMNGHKKKNIPIQDVESVPLANNNHYQAQPKSAEQMHIEQVIEFIWNKYDIDHNGNLSREETEFYVKETLVTLGQINTFT